MKHKEEANVKQEQSVDDDNNSSTAAAAAVKAEEPEFDGVEVEYVAESVPAGVDDDNEFSSIFNRFQKLGNQQDQTTATNATTA